MTVHSRESEGEREGSLALELAAGPTQAICLAKRALATSLSLSLNEALSVEAELRKVCLDSEDHREAVLARLEKRKPAFKGS